MKALQFSVSVPQWLALKLVGRISRQAFYSGPLATAKLVDLPEPRLPSPEWVRIKTLVCGFCASDLNLITLHDSPTASPFTSFPCVMGHEVSGEVVEAGPAVTGLVPGDRVAVAPALSCRARGIEPLCPPCAAGLFAACEKTAAGILAPGMFTGICKDTGGGFSPFFVAHQSQCFKLPEGVSPEHGALIEPLSVGLQTAYTNRPRPGDNLLVIGGGVIGSMIVQALRFVEPDCRITVAERSTFAAEFCKSVGADQVAVGGSLFDHAERHAGAVRYRPMMGPAIMMGGFQRIYDTVGNSATLNAALRCLASGGTLSQVGIGGDVKLDLTPLWLKKQTIVGVYGCGYAEYQGVRRHMFEIGLDLARTGQVHLDGVITHRFALEDFARMIEVNMNKDRHRAMKTVVTFTP